MDKESSDEKLLKLIEGAARAPGLSKPGFPAGKAGIKPKARPPAFSLPSLFKALPSLFKAWPKIDLARLNKIFFVIAALLTLTFLYGLIADSRSSGADPVFPGGTSPQVFKAQADGRAINTQEYLAAFGKRNIFLPAGKKAAGADGQAGELAKLSDLLKDLKLVGVIWSASPEVMIEDAFDKRTYLLKKGETFGQNQYKVKEITRSSAILEVQMAGEKKEYELR